MNCVLPLLLFAAVIVVVARKSSTPNNADHSNGLIVYVFYKTEKSKTKIINDIGETLKRY